MATSGLDKSRLKLLAAALILAGASVSVPGTPAFAATAETMATTADTATVTLLTGQVVPLDPTKRTSAQETAYRNQISQLHAQGKLTPSVMAQMGLRVLTPSSDAVSPTHAPMAPSTAKPSDFSPMACSIDNPQTSATAISLATPTIVLNGSSQGYIMYANASYKWTSPPEAPSTCRVKVGGVDGFALTLDKAVVNLGVSFIGCNAFNKCASTGYLATNSQYGGGWAMQDWAGAITTGYSDTYSGTLTYAFRFNGGLQCVQAFSKYGHTWNSTSLTGFSIGPWSIGISWSSTSSNWEKSSQAGRYSC